MKFVSKPCLDTTYDEALPAPLKPCPALEKGPGGWKGGSRGMWVVGVVAESMSRPRASWPKRWSFTEKRLQGKSLLFGKIEK